MRRDFARQWDLFLILIPLFLYFYESVRCWMTKNLNSIWWYQRDAAYWMSICIQNHLKMIPDEYGWTWSHLISSHPTKSLSYSFGSMILHSYRNISVIHSGALLGEIWIKILIKNYPLHGSMVVLRYSVVQMRGIQKHTPVLSLIDFWLFLCES